MLCWAAEADEEKSPGLTKFTEHFNNVSQWYVHNYNSVSCLVSCVIIIIMIVFSGRNKGQKLVGHLFKDRKFCR